jgi:hypothetical protein
MSESIRITNIKDYIWEFIDDDLILTPKYQTITEKEIQFISLTGSIILDCIVSKDNNIISNKTKYRSILLDIWKSLPTQKILQTSTFNFKLTKEDGINGYYYNEDIKLSFQSKDANGTFTEIFKQIKENKYTIYIKIQLQNNKII